jgi:hypothetical protein
MNTDKRRYKTRYKKSVFICVYLWLKTFFALRAVFIFLLCDEEQDQGLLKI